MTERSQPKQPQSRSPRLNKRGLSFLVAGSTLVGGTAGYLEGHAGGVRSAQPGCEIVASPQDSAKGVTGIEHRMNADNHPYAVLAPSGVVRDATNSSSAGESVVVQPGDRVEVATVDPQVCLQLGGVLVANSVVENRANQ